MQRPIELTSALAALLAPTLAIAQRTGPDAAGVASQPDEVVTVGTRIDEEQFDIGEPLTITSLDLSLARVADTEQLLQRLPGFSVSRTGGPGGVSEVFLRGAESNFTAVYVDGVRLNDPTNSRGGSFDYSLLAASDIERVDVARGSMSAIYGADAMAGVIRISSGWAEPGTSDVMLEIGSTNDWRASADASLQLGRNVEWSVRASTLDGGDDIEGSSLRADSIATRVLGTWAGRGDWRVDLRRTARDRSSFPEVSGGPSLAVNRELEIGAGDELAIAASSRWAVGDNWVTEIEISDAQIRDDTSVPAIAPGVLDGQPAFSSRTDYARTQALWINRVALPSGSQLVAGLDLVREQGRDDGTVDLGFAIVPNAYALDRSLKAVFAELGKRWRDGWTTTLAMRLDATDTEHSRSGQLGIAKSIGANGSFIWGRLADGFKLPSFFSLGNPLFGNPNLAAERVQSAELGYSHEFAGATTLSLALFDSRYTNLVDFDFETFTSVNRGRIDVDGIEIRVNASASPTLQISGDVTWSNIVSVSGPLRRRPERTGGMALAWRPTDRWQLDLSARYIGSRLITSIRTGDVDEPGVTLISVTGNLALTPAHTLWIALDNVLDEAYQDAPGFPSRGARLRLGMRASL